MTSHALRAAGSRSRIVAISSRSLENMAGSVLWEKKPPAWCGTRDGDCRIAQRQLYLERFEDCRAIVRNLPEAHAARKVVRRMWPGSGRAAVRALCLQQNMLGDAAHDIDFLTLQTRAREQPAQARHQLLRIGRVEKLQRDQRAFQMRKHARDFVARRS